MKKTGLTLFVLFLGLQLWAQTGLKTGQQAPEFTAKASDGTNINLKTLLKKYQNVVLFFYRGWWCPYCNKHIKQLQDSLQLLSKKGAFVIGVTPESENAVIRTREKTTATFPIISDKNYTIMKAYGVDFTMEKELQDKYKKYGVDVALNNDSKDAILPIPATYVIGASGKIKYVQFNKDYTKRASVSTILSML
jgi:peroxiredoxin